MAASKSIHMNFISLPLVGIPPFFFSSNVEISAFDQIPGSVPRRVFGPQDCIYCLSPMKVWPQGWLWALRFLSNCSNVNILGLHKAKAALLWISQVGQTLRSHQVRAGWFLTERRFYKYFSKFSF